LKEHGITLMPRLTQFYQGITSGSGDHDFEYGGKADLLLNAELSKLGFWKGLLLTIHAEYNFGHSVNGRGGTLMPVHRSYTSRMIPMTCSRRRTSSGKKSRMPRAG
jgi:porin